MRVACIGTRDATRLELQLCRAIGSYLVRKGHTISTGNALGCDQAYAYGANTWRPKQVELWLPWPSYEKDAIREGNIVHAERIPQWAFEMAERMHPAWDRCSQAVRKLHARNCQIVRGCGLVIALPGKFRLGGTGQGMRVAKHLGIPVRDLRSHEGAVRVLKKVGLEDYVGSDWAAVNFLMESCEVPMDRDKAMVMLEKRPITDVDDYPLDEDGAPLLTREAGVSGFYTSSNTPTISGVIEQSFWRRAKKSA